MIKILTYTPVYGRPQILAIMLKGLKRLINYKPEKFVIQPFFVVSTPEDEAIIKATGFDYMVFKNNPLGEKKNAGLQYALQNFDFDYLMEIGSDDLITNSYLDFIEPEFLAGTPQFNLSNCWFIDINTGKKATWQTDIVLGAGRCISRAALEKTLIVPFVFTTSLSGPDVSYTPKLQYPIPIKSATHYQNCNIGNIVGGPVFSLWNHTGNSGMDTFSMHTLARFGIENKIIKTDQIFTLDIKSDVGINTIKPFKPTRKNVLKPFAEAAEIKKLIK